ncbi:YceI family protein [Caulobacter sp. 17J80-11]|uniref:YceI family protein n=1 Tax=Caulobacter sp. 17J80-11 TaxID=2763502 RepID=UPI001653EC1E|nr:YceI family protein [Caulobacter sp. 17J80-11]MBC6983055.1 polyisoprenoid-binding protein [Caulobacter sp. 17J80-11]
MIRATLIALAAAAAFAGTADAQGRGWSGNPADQPAGTYAVDARHSSATVRGVHMGFSNYTFRIDGVGGTLKFDPKDASAISITATLDPATVHTGLPDFDKEIGGAFFGGTPITFVSKSVVPQGGNAAKVAGDLTLNGVTKPVTLDVTFIGGGPHPFKGKPVLGFQAEGAFKRSDFDVAPKLPANVFSDEVRVSISAEFDKQ